MPGNGVVHVNPGPLTFDLAPNDAFFWSQHAPGENFLVSIPARSVSREGSGSVLVCLTRDQRAAGSSLTSVTVLCP